MAHSLDPGVLSPVTPMYTDLLARDYHSPSSRYHKTAVLHGPGESTTARPAKRMPRPLTPASIPTRENLRKSSIHLRCLSNVSFIKKPLIAPSRKTPSPILRHHQNLEFCPTNDIISAFALLNPILPRSATLFASGHTFLPYSLPFCDDPDQPWRIELSALWR